VFLRFAGARPGEARMLQWSNVQDEFETIILRQHKTSYKTDEPRRIFFNHVIVRLLVWLLAHGEQQSDYVFVNGHGRRWTIKALTKHFRAVCRRAGLPDDVKCHGGRHTFATNALMNGVDIATLAQLLGHSDVKSTQRYIHLVNKQEHLNGAMNRAIGKGVS
jgi:integrase